MLHDWIDRCAARLVAVDGETAQDYAQPAGEPGLLAPDAVSWQVFRNPVTLLIGGTAAVVLELAEPRVRSGVYDHSSFRSDPMRRLRRTGRATMVTVYGARSRAESMIAHVNAMHRSMAGTTPDGQPYRATDPDLLTWVHATASYGFLEARHRYVAPISVADQDRYYVEGQCSAGMYGAVDSPRSRAAMASYIVDPRRRLEPSPLTEEFLRLMMSLPLLPRALAPLQGWLVRASLDLVPASVRERIALGGDWLLPPPQRAAVRLLARRIDAVPLPRSPAAQACRRLGLPADHLWRALRA